jgi:hypothetical protein
MPLQMLSIQKKSEWIANGDIHKDILCPPIFAAEVDIFYHPSL